MVKEDEKEIVIFRLESMPENIKLSIGKFGAFDKWDLIEHVKNEDEIGEIVVKMYMSNLRAFKKEVE